MAAATIVPVRTCPCTSGRPYKDCCGPLHRGQEAASPEALMRSRFAAFAVGDVDYLWRTLHPDHEDRALDRDEALASLRATARALKFMRLAILETTADTVTFRASVYAKGVDRSFTERSTFAHDGAGWRYLCGEMLEP